MSAGQEPRPTPSATTNSGREYSSGPLRPSPPFRRRAWTRRSPPSPLLGFHRSSHLRLFRGAGFPKNLSPIPEPNLCHLRQPWLAGRWGTGFGGTAGPGSGFRRGEHVSVVLRHHGTGASRRGTAVIVGSRSTTDIYSGSAASSVCSAARSSAGSDSAVSPGSMTDLKNCPMRAISS